MRRGPINARFFPRQGHPQLLVFTGFRRAAICGFLIFSILGFLRFSAAGKAHKKSGSAAAVPAPFVVLL
jgi:hypothetical protein